MTRMLRAAAAAALIAGLAAPAQADEIEEALKMALEAYQAGDLSAAKEEIDYAAQLIAQQKAAGLSDFLPEPLEGWERIDGDSQGASAAAMFGGGMMATASYRRGDENVEIELMANNQMVTAMATMFGNAAMMGSLGQVRRINRQKVVLTQEGELQAMIDNRIMVRVSGQASVEDKEAYFAALDIRGLEDF